MALRMPKQSLVTTCLTMSGLRTTARPKLLSVLLSPLAQLKKFLKPNSTKSKRQDLLLQARVSLLRSLWLQKVLLVLLSSSAQTVLQTLVLVLGTNAILTNKLLLPKDSMRMLENLPAKPVLPSILSLLRVMNAILMLSALLQNSQAVLSSVSTQLPLQKISPQCFQFLLQPQTSRLRSSCTKVFNLEMRLILTFPPTSHSSHADLATRQQKLSSLSSMV